jgi:hypothetical protein
VLRDAGLVKVRADAQRRWYELDPAPLAEMDEWLAPYRWMWADGLDALERHLCAGRCGGTGHGPRLLLTHEGGGSDPSAVGAELRGFLERLGA